MHALTVSFYWLRLVFQQQNIFVVKCPRNKLPLLVILSRNINTIYEIFLQSSWQYATRKLKSTFFSSSFHSLTLPSQIDLLYLRYLLPYFFSKSSNFDRTSAILKGSDRQRQILRSFLQSMAISTMTWWCLNLERVYLKMFEVIFIFFWL